MNKPLVIYHANCADGFGAAFAAWLKLGVDQLLSSSARFVRMEPPVPMVGPQLQDDLEGRN